MFSLTCGRTGKRTTFLGAQSGAAIFSHRSHLPIVANHLQFYFRRAGDEKNDRAVADGTPAPHHFPSVGISIHRNPVPHQHSISTLDPACTRRLQISSPLSVLRAQPVELWQHPVEADAVFWGCLQPGDVDAVCADSGGDAGVDGTPIGLSIFVHAHSSAQNLFPAHFVLRHGGRGDVGGAGVDFGGNQGILLPLVQF